MAINRILLVDDDPIIRSVTRDFLKLMHFEVALADNGREALKLFRQNDYDLVITDVMMPVMSGLELIRELRKENEFIPVIVVSGSDPDSLSDLENDCTRAMQKPYPLSILMANIDSLSKLQARSVS